MCAHRIISINIHGLRNKLRRLAFFRQIRQSKCAVCCVQEAYITQSDVETWKKEWGGELLFVEGTSHSKGQIILINKQCMSNDLTILHQSDRVLALSMQLDDQQLAIINVYSPSIQSEKTGFLEEISRVFDSLPACTDHTLLLGDFNMVMDNKLDVISGNGHSKSEIQQFNNTINSLGLNDIWRLFHLDERQYTWHRTNPFVARRLDYTFACDSLINNIVGSGMLNIPNTDHKGVYCDIQFSNIVRGPSYWKFNNSLLKGANYVEKMNLFLEEIAEEQDLEPQLNWDFCKVRIREFTINYSKCKAKDNQSKMCQLKYRLETAEKELCDDPNNEDKLREVTKTKFEYDLQALQYARGAQTRARVKWIEEGERNTKYFCNLEKVRSVQKSITRLTDDGGNTVTDQNQLLDMQHSYYKKLYSKKVDYEREQANMSDFLSDVTIPQLSEDEQSLCEGDVSVEDAGNALKSMKNGSSPGCDGLTTEFLKLFWTRINHMLVNSYKAAFTSGELSTTQRRGVLTLLHKGKELPREELDNWRPISLTNTDYKILAKVLAHRLQHVIKSIINENQVGYMKGRNIGTILRLIDDTINYMDFNDLPGMILAVDYTKAFDTISKDFVIDVFRIFGFGEQFTQWVKVLMSNTESCVNYSGWLTDFFPLESGIRQGCPFSPLAFILAVELFSLKIRQCPEIKGIQLPGCGKTTQHKIGQYADDATLFLRDEDDVRAATKIVDEFTVFSGLHINANKTEMMWLGRDKRRRDSVQGFKCKHKLKILGVFYSNTEGAQVDDNWLNKIKGMEKLVKVWDKRDLSIMGKIQVVKTFLLSQFIYVMQAVGLPDSVLVTITRIIYKFLWKRKMSNKRAFEKVKRTVLCKDFKDGGLKAIDCFDMQQSFYLSCVTKLNNTESDNWTSIPLYWFGKLGRDLSVLESSVLCKNFKGLELIKSRFWRCVLTNWLVHNTSISQKSSEELNIHEIYAQKLWNNKFVMYRQNPLMIQACVSANIICVADILKEKSIISYDEYCNKLGSSPDRIFEYNAIVNAIPKCWKDKIASYSGTVELNNAGLTFRGTPVHVMSCKLYRNNIVNNKSSTTICAVGFWERKFEIKLSETHWQVAVNCTQEVRLRVLQWKILHNIFPTNILLHKMGLRTSRHCSYCDETDFIEHFFYECTHINKLWTEIENIITCYTGHRLNLSVTDILFGVFHPVMNKKQYIVINHLILIGKMCISKIKYGKGGHLLSLFHNEVIIRKVMP
jgi:exonuclease III